MRSLSFFERISTEVNSGYYKYFCVWELSLLVDSISILGFLATSLIDVLEFNNISTKYRTLITSSFIIPQFSAPS